MIRSKSGIPNHSRRKKLLRMAKGYQGRSKNCYSIALRRVEKGLQYAYRDRRTKKRYFRKLWIQRINAASRSLGLTYSRFIRGIQESGLFLNRKVIADLALSNNKEFQILCEQVKIYLLKKEMIDNIS